MAFGFNDDKSRVEVPTKTEYDLTKLKVEERTFNMNVPAGQTRYYALQNIPASRVAIIPVLWGVENPNTHVGSYSALVQVYMAYGLDPTFATIPVINSSSENLDVFCRVYIFYKPED